MTDTTTEAPGSTGGTSPEQRRTPSVVDPGRPDYMSYSRMNSILTCGEQFRLERVLKLPSGEHWASIGGNAFHETVEQILKSELGS